MKLLRKILLPFSLLYWFITALRNLLYNAGIFKSHSYTLPVIAVGNLSTGGTGKTPLTEYLIRLLSSHYTIATLSRGYKRKSKGFILGDNLSTADTLGDEPYQFRQKFPEVTVAVDADRVNGIAQLMGHNPRLQVLLLDDAYQHRRVKAGLYILLTAYGDLYTDDYILPAGNLRESRSGARRAAIIIVTKCPPALTINEQDSIKKKLAPTPGQQVFFTTIAYDDAVYCKGSSLPLSAIKDTAKVLVAGIAKPKPFFDHLDTAGTILKKYADHHDFSESELQELNLLSNDKLIITTEKDYMRLQGKLPAGRLYYLPIKSQFLSGKDDFDTTILHYVEQSTGNR